MATAGDIINRAMRLVGALESGETPTANESADVLTALNQMIDSWRTERLVAYQVVDYTLTLTPGDAEYTIIASTGDIAQERPIRVESADITEGGIDYSVDIISKAAWDGITDKTTTSNLPNKLYYEPAYPAGKIHLHPVPSAANVLSIGVWQPIGTFATTATAVSLPPGYERALTYNLAVEIAPEFQQAVSDVVAGIALNSKAAIKRANIVPIVAPMEMAAGRRYDIYSES